MLRKLLLSVMVIALMAPVAVSAQVADESDEVSGQEFVQILVDFDKGVSFDQTTANVFTGKRDKLRVVLEAIEDGTITGSIDPDGARQLEEIFQGLSDSGVLNPDLERLNFALSNIYEGIAPVTFTPELATILLDAGYRGKYPSRDDEGFDPYLEEQDARLARNRWIAVAIGVGIVLLGAGIVVARRNRA